MNQAVSIDLNDLQDAIEHLAKQLVTASVRTKVDVAARLNAVVKTACEITTTIKDELKATHPKDDYVLGEVFKAKVAYNEVTRLDQKTFKAERPKIYDAYLVTTTEGRVTFEAR